MDTGQFFCWYVDIVVKQCVKVLFGEFFPFECVLNKFPSCEHWVKIVRILTKKVTQIRVSQIRVSQIRASQIRATVISSNHRELHGAIFSRTTVFSCPPPPISCSENWDHPISFGVQSSSVWSTSMHAPLVRTSPALVATLSLNFTKKRITFKTAWSTCQRGLVLVKVCSHSDFVYSRVKSGNR